MTTGWILINIAISAGVTAFVSSVAVLVPLRLSRAEGEVAATYATESPLAGALPALESAPAAAFAV